MVARSDTPRLTLPIALTGASVAALLAMAVCLAIPVAVFESVVEWSEMAEMLPIAAPPLGWTARGAIALAGGIAAALAVWLTLYFRLGRRRVGVRVPVLARRAKTGLSVRRADAHPDAPPRAPILAQREFGRPVPEPADTSDPTERPLPADLATPLADYHPDAIPRAPVRAAPLAPGERIETFELAHNVPPEHAHSIESLLARLEQGARLRGMARSVA